MTNQKTLFSRYKNMINNLWEDGQRKYTANELNTFVGHHENITRWKRWNNNPFYTTRTYQTALKHLGCITKIKRGLWQINGPIPEWFGSFHVNALTNTGALKELEKSSIYWQSLLAEHKVNPWKAKMHFYTESIDDDAQMEDDIAGGMRNCGDTDYYNTNNTNTMNKTTDCVMQTITGIALLEEFPQLTLTTQVSVYPADGGDYGVDICDWQYVVSGKEVTKDVADSICGAFNKEVSVLYTAAVKKLEQELINEAIAKDATLAKAEVITKDGGRLYTAEDVKKILKAFIKEAEESVSEVVSDTIDGVDERDVVELEWDSWGRTMEVTLDLSSVARDAASEAVEAMKDTLYDFNIEAALS